MSDQLTLILGAPGEAEMPLLADLGTRSDVRILAVVDPSGACLGAAIAEIMGLPVLGSLDGLDLGDGNRPLMVLPAEPASEAAALARLAQDHGLEFVRPDELRARLAQPVQPAPPRPASVRANGSVMGAIDQETAALQASLSDLEDALAGDAFMKRLVELCNRAVGASGGSIMLFDDTSRELYIAYAAGLSEGTIHSTRVKLGEGISGRVAHSRTSTLVEGQHGPEGRHRDRPDIATAICTPLVADDKLLGVLNVSTHSNQAPLTQASLKIMEGLAQRLGRILNEVLGLQRQRTSRMFHLTEQQLRRLAGDHQELPAMLAAWTSALAITAEADLVCLAVPCEDGSLLLAEGTQDMKSQHWYEPMHNPAWLEVLGSGLPMVARQESPTVGDREPVTVFYLPVGRQPVKAGLAVHFSGSRLAHAFHALAGETAFLMDRLLPDLLTQRRQAHRAEMLSRMSSTMSTLTTGNGTPGSQLDKLCEVSRELTGADYAVAVAELGDDMPRLAGGNAPESAAWLGECGRLLEAASEEGWRITTLETRGAPVSVLVVANPGGEVVPGLVLVGKERTHDLDGRVFTPLDAELVLPMAGLLTRLMPPPVVKQEVLPEPEELMTGMSTLAESFDIRPAGVQSGDENHDPADSLQADLTREMDRCDRYHNVFGLLLLRPELPSVAALDLLDAAARRLAERLRISDRVYTLPCGEMALLIPEDIRNLKHLQERVTEDLRDLTGNPDLVVLTARGAYPSVKGPASTFLETLRKRLSP